MSRRQQDRTIFERFIRSVNREGSEAFPGRLVLETGKFFLGTPYRAGTLEAKGGEHLVVNLREFDCFTFVENVVALAWCVEHHLQESRRSHSRSGGATSRPNVTGGSAAGVRLRQESFEAFRRLLKKIRYRQGRLQGYPSRLHYFSDWIRDNQKKGILKDVTAELGGMPLKKPLHFMTAHPDRYPALREAVNLRRMKSLEKTISKSSLSFIPKNHLRRLEDRILDGDVIAITTSRQGLDVQHAGLAVRVKNRIHLIHASSIEGKVVLSQKTLRRYLMESIARAGIIVGRIEFSLDGSE